MNQEQYDKFKNIAIKICNNDEKTYDLLHDIIIQLTTNKIYNTLSDKDKVFFFIRTLKNQYYSNNSKFHKTYRKYSFDTIPENYELVDEVYKEMASIEWVKETLQEELNNNKEFWYNYGIFHLYIEHKRLERLHKITQIPKYSLRITLKEVKQFLNLKWEQYTNGEN
jgi:hypothetical protein